LVLEFLTGGIQGDIENRYSFKEGWRLPRDDKEGEEFPNALPPPDCSHFLWVAAATAKDEWLLLRTQAGTCAEAMVLVWNLILTTIV
jgi:hypothetical protein